jgi:hypothetical protein
VLSPVLVHSIKDTVKDPFAAVAGAEGAHGTDVSAHFHKESFNHVCRAQTTPLRWRERSAASAFPFLKRVIWSAIIDYVIVVAVSR